MLMKLRQLWLEILWFTLKKREKCLGSSLERRMWCIFLCLLKRALQCSFEMRGLRRIAGIGDFWGETGKSLGVRKLGNPSAFMLLMRFSFKSALIWYILHQRSSSRYQGRLWSAPQWSARFIWEALCIQTTAKWALWDDSHPSFFT